MNRLTIAILAALALPSTASAASLQPLPFDPAAGPCLSATGAPGGIALLGPYSRRESATDLLTAGGDGTTRSARVQIGRMVRCADVAEAPGGAAVVAGMTVDRDYDVELRAVVRDPGGAFGEPAVLSDQGLDSVAAVGPAGHAVVAWSEKRGRRHRILAVRRTPGGAFGAPETLVDARTDRQVPDVELAATVDAVGVATLLWSRELPSDDFDEHVEAATAAPGGAFAVQRVAAGVSTSGPPILAGAPDGWAVAVLADQAPRVFERAPGGVFQPVALPALPGRDAARTDVTAAVREGGGAVLAWRVFGNRRIGGVEALTRAAAGEPWALRRVAPAGPEVSSPSSEEQFLVEPFFNPFDFLAGPPYDDRRRELEAAVSRDGRVVVAWSDGAGRAPLRVETAHVVLGRLDGTFEPAQRLGATLRQTLDVAPLVLSDGRAAVAWTDSASGLRHGRLHLAVEGSAPPAPAAAPELRLDAPRRQRLFPSQSPRVIARCASACDVRAIVLGPHGDRSEPIARTRLRGGRSQLRVGGLREGTAKVVVHAGAPGGDAVTTRSVRIRVAHRRPLPLGRPLDVTARRRGDHIVVRWRAAVPARRQLIVVAGQDRRDRLDPDRPGTAKLVWGRGRRRFTVRLRLPAGTPVTHVAVVATSIDSDAERIVLVKVRR